MILNTCEDPSVLRTIYFIKTGLDIIIMLIPIPFIAKITYDLFKNIISSNEDNNKKVLAMSLRRIIYLVILFLIPTIVSVGINKINTLFDYDIEWTTCIKNANKSDIEKYQALYDAKIEELKKEQEGKSDYLEVEDMPRLDYSYTKSYGDATSSGDGFLDTSKRIWTKIVTSVPTFKYRVPNDIPITTHYCNCSSYVSWVLYEYGYKDFEGTQKRSTYFYSTDLNKKYGWTTISVGRGEDISNKVQPGDIVVRVPIGKSNNTPNGHIAIISSTNGSQPYAYDCGQDDNIAKKKDGTPVYPNGRPENWFLKSKRGNGMTNNPGKIIRVTPPNK